MVQVNEKQQFKSGMTINGVCTHTGRNLKFKITTYEKHPDNEAFKKLLDNLDLIKKKFDMVKFKLNSVDASVIQKGSGHICRTHNSLEMYYAEETYLRVSPYKNGLEITKVIVNEKYRSKGIGEMIMYGLFLMLNTVDVDITKIPIMLECTGNTGIDYTPIKYQTKFFRKFGFRVNHKESKYDGESGYVQMFLDHEKWSEWMLSKTNSMIKQFA